VASIRQRGLHDALIFGDANLRNSELAAFCALGLRELQGVSHCVTSRHVASRRVTVAITTFVSDSRLTRKTVRILFFVWILSSWLYSCMVGTNN
jgi:hypothetical protein